MVFLRGCGRQGKITSQDSAFLQCVKVKGIGFLSLLQILHFWGVFIHPWLLPSPSSLDSHPRAPSPLHLIPHIKATPPQGCSTSSPKSHRPHFPTALSSQELLSSCTRREFCLFSHLCNMVRRPRLTPRHQNGHSSVSGTLGYTSFFHKVLGAELMGSA